MPGGSGTCRLASEVPLTGTGAGIKSESGSVRFADARASGRLGFIAQPIERASGQLGFIASYIFLA